MNSVNSALVPEVNDLIVAPQSPSLWATVEAMAKGPAEAAFLRTIVGDELVREVEVARDELQSLLAILTDLRDRDAPPRASVGTAPPRPPTLLGASSLLQQRLRALLEASRAADTLPTPRERMIAEYIVNGNRPPSSGSVRPTSRLSASLRSATTRSRPSSSSSSTSPAYFDPAAELDPLRGKIRFDRVHEIEAELRELFHHERDLVLQDVASVRAAIESEMHWKTFAEPTTKELATMTSKLEQEAEARDHREKVEALPFAASRGGILPAMTLSAAGGGATREESPCLGSPFSVRPPTMVKAPSAGTPLAARRLYR